MPLLISVLYGLTSMIPMGIGSAISPIVTKKIGIGRVMLWRNMATSLLLLIALAFNWEAASFIPLQIFYALLLSLLAYIALAFYFKALLMGKVGLISPTTATNVILSLSLSAVFLGVAISKTQLLFISLIIVGTILIAFNFKDFKQSSMFRIKSGVPYALATAFCWGIFFFLAQIPLRALGVYLTSFIFELGMLVATIIHLMIIKESFRVPEFKTLRIVWLISLLNALSIVGLYTGLLRANVGIVLTLSASTPLVIAVYGKVVYKERLSKLQYLAIALVLIGIIALTNTK